MEAARRFADLLRNVEYVEKVILEEAGMEGLRLWAVISSPPFEERYRDPVYEAQSAVIDMLNAPVFDFRIVNLNELNGQVEDSLPKASEILYERPVHA
jgi:hypothetical protein